MYNVSMSTTQQTQHLFQAVRYHSDSIMALGSDQAIVDVDAVSKKVIIYDIKEPAEGESGILKEISFNDIQLVIEQPPAGTTIITKDGKKHRMYFINMPTWKDLSTSQKVVSTLSLSTGDPGAKAIRDMTNYVEATPVKAWVEIFKQNNVATKMTFFQTKKGYYVMIVIVNVVLFALYNILY